MIPRTVRYDSKAKHAALYWQYSPLLTMIKQDETIRLREMLEMSQEDMLQCLIKLRDKSQQIEKLTMELRLEKDKNSSKQSDESDETGDFDFCE